LPNFNRVVTGGHWSSVASELLDFLC
jgi:hypothetical protein